MTKEEILAGESEVLEFKRDVPEQSIKFIKTVVAFANGKGGMIVFGVDDNRGHFCSRGGNDPRSRTIYA